ncbi:hypothetical protein CBS101457_004476 [Exobasidium rhododendri]|nr:hypothetical protein CBS101457_004476 [Exobasidium rhododendri]
MTSNNSNGNDSSFDSFIDSNQMLESGSPAPSTPMKSLRMSTNPKLAPLSALPSRLLESNGGNVTPNVNDFLSYPQTSSSTVTTPTTSNTSSLHNLNFDFYDTHGDDQSTSASNSFHSSNGDDHSNLDAPILTTFGDASMDQAGSLNHSPASNHVFSWNSSNSFFPIPMAHSFPHTTEDLEHDARQNASHHHHHQRSLSLRDVAPPTAADGALMESLTTLPFPLVKMEEDQDQSFASSYNNDAPSPITEDRSSPSSSAIGSLFDGESPRNDKKRRLTSPSESSESNNAVRSGKSATVSKSNTSSGNAKKTHGGARGSRANTMNGKVSPPNANALGFSASSLIENENVTASKAMEQTMSAVEVQQLPPTQQQQQQQQQLQPLQQQAQQQGVQMPVIDSPPPSTSQHLQQPYSGSLIATSIEAPQHSDHDRSNSPLFTANDPSAPPKSGNKRPPPSASQITESGQPFPVIDTSAKHSSLFVPPDTSGLTKREARLVKNRAAAFLSRQRKREQFEELEIKCKFLCRLVWRFWEIVAGPNQDVSFHEKYSQTRILPLLLQEESVEVKEVLEMVVALKGGSVAPTEDGQLQGAVAAGINSANGKLIPDPSAKVDAPKASPSTSTSSPVAVPHFDESKSELARLRAELQESKKRESTLKAELAQERSIRMNENYHNTTAKPFKGGKQDEALSLTISPKYQEEEDEDEEEDGEGGKGISSRGRFGGDAVRRRSGSGRSVVPSGPARTSERLQRQQSQLALTSNSTAANGGQRKAAGAALMMVLFSFALFGLPNGQMSRVGGITRAGSTEDFSVGKVLGAPLSGAKYNQDDDEEMLDYDATCKQAPSSHLSVKDLLPPMPELSDLLNLEDADEMDDMSNRSSSFTQSFRDVLGGSQVDDGDHSIDYTAFAKDLGASLDWDVQRGFIVLGSDHEQSDDDDEAKEGGKKEKDGETKEEGSREAPTKLTLFVPAPDIMGEMLEAEDRFYDAPLAEVATIDTTFVSEAHRGDKGDGEEGNSSNQSNARELTQVEATRAALRVLRNHRIAQEAAALATSRRLGKKPSPSQRIDHSQMQSSDRHSPSLHSRRSSSSTSAGGNGRSFDSATDASQQHAKTKLETEEDQDYSKDVMDASTTTDKIRGTDFYQLEFSLSGAKVRNVAELAKLLGVARNKKE